MLAKRSIIAAAVALIAAAGVHLPDIAKAGDDDAAERAALASATITLQQAILAAETEADGKAVESGVDDENGDSYYYKVEIRAADGVEKEVLVDMKTGKVVKITADD